MLSTATLMGFVATADAAAARQFYQNVLGLELVEDGPYALVFAVPGTSIRVQKVEAVAPAPYTALGWRVADIAAEVRQLAARGLRFERYAGLPQDEHGIWRTPAGAAVAWFRDPDGNTLSLTEHAR